MTYLCVPIFVQNIDQAKRDIATAVEAGAEMIELRLDNFHDDISIRRILDGTRVPLIFTCRSQDEGGTSELSVDARLKFAEQCASLASKVDVELASYQHRWLRVD